MSVSSTPEPSSGVASSASSLSFFSNPRRGLTVSELTPDISHIPPNADINEYPLIRIGRQLYLKADWLKLKRKRTSWVSDYGTYLVEVSDKYEKKKIWWSCNLCDTAKKIQLYAASSTNAADGHLRQEHKAHTQSQSTDQEINSSKRPRHDVLAMQRLAAQGNLIPRPKAESFKALLIKWIVEQNLPLTAVESDTFRDLLCLLSKEVDAYLPLSGDTIHNWIMTEFDLRKQSIKRQLYDEPISKIHLTFDMWTSDNKLALLGVVAHYLDKTTWKNRSRLIALRRITGIHSGENMASHLLEVAQEYEISDKLGFFTLDNAGTNDTCLHTFLAACQPNVTNDEVKSRRIRCFGHVLNLAAKAFLFGKNADAFEVEDNVLRTLGHELEHRDAWRKYGPVGKLHNVIVFIRRTPQRKELFQSVCNLEEPGFDDMLLNEETQKLGVLQDNATRWNSTYKMIERALQKRDEIDTFIRRCQRERDTGKRVPAEDHLTTEDWLLLAETAAILKPFYTQTMRLQSRAADASHGSIWEALPTMELILDHLEDMKVVYQDFNDPPSPPVRRRRRQQPNPHQSNEELNDSCRRHIRTAVNNAWAKLDEYYNLTNDSPVYVAALVLHPGHKWKYINERWDRDDWKESAKDAFKSFYERYWQNREVEADSQPVKEERPGSREYDEFQAWMTPHGYYTSQDVAVDDYDSYLIAPPMKISNPITWWREHQTNYPKLAQMAFDLLSIPAMSAECERVFSQAKLVVNDMRNRMTDDTIDAIQCLKNWTSQGAIDWDE
jgi:hypothetical protein